LYAAVAACAALAAGGWLVIVVARPGRPLPSPPFAENVARAIGRAEPLFAAIGIALLVWGGWVLLTAGLDLVRAERFEGRIVRLRSHQGMALWWEMPRFPTRYYLALDDGSGDRLRAYRVPHAMWVGVDEGERVAVIATRRLGFVERIERLDPPLHRRHRAG
jgi:hypothetical protein